MSALYLLLFFTFIFENQIEHTKIEQYLFLRIKLNYIIFKKKKKKKDRTILKIQFTKILLKIKSINY